MIDLVLSKGQVFVWNADDWLKLRSEHRIVGELIGCLPKKSRQDILHGLPLLLQAEEVTLLLEKNIARLVSYPCVQQRPSESLKKTFEDYRTRMFDEQKECLQRERKNKVCTMMDQIVEGKRRKILGIETARKKMKKPLSTETQEALNSIEIDRDALMAEEIAKIPKLERHDALIQIHTAYPWSKDNDIKTASWNYPTTAEDKLRYRTFKDLWERGFYITSGDKFGGDFLAYPGDPIMFHSQFIVECTDRNKEIPITELAGVCRVAVHVRKTQVFATFANDSDSEVKYQSFQWAHSNMFAPF